MMTVTTLTDGGQPPLADRARRSATFLAGARTSLDIAVYDLKLDGETERLVIGAIEDAGRRGVAVRLAYNADFRAPIPVPPPPKAVPEDVEALHVPTKAIAGHSRPDAPQVRRPRRHVGLDGLGELDGRLVVPGGERHRRPRLARARARVHARLRAALGRPGTSTEPARSSRARCSVDGVEVRPWFCPGFGDALSHRIAKAIGRARRRIRICSPVITAAPVLATLAQVIADGKVDVAGAVDQTQIEEVRDQWGPTGVASWKLPLLEQVIGSGRFAGKRSTPWSPDSVHDFMHAKLTVADDVVFLGSFNLSHSGEQNAENVLEIHDPALAERLAGFVDGVRARYPAATLDRKR